jgi:hypothetical protein
VVWLGECKIRTLQGQLEMRPMTETTWGARHPGARQVQQRLTATVAMDNLEKQQQTMVRHSDPKLDQLLG